MSIKYKKKTITDFFNVVKCEKQTVQDSNVGLKVLFYCYH